MDRLAVSVADACFLTGLKKTTIYAEIATGHLPARKFGSKTLIETAALREWLDALPSAARRVPDPPVIH